MILLIIFAFLAGIVTLLSPCILPILPIVLSGSLTGGKKRPWGIVVGFVLSFTLFTLFLSALVRATRVSPDALRTLSVIIIFLFGVSLLIPQTREWLERLFSKLASRAPHSNAKEGFGGGVLIGLSLGLIWTPCVGPILASVISLALSGSVSTAAVAITLSYSLGTALPMLAIMYGGRTLLQKVPWLLANTERIQKAFAVLMILVAIAIQFNYDRRFQAYILENFPQYGAGLTKFEEKKAIQDHLQELQKRSDAVPRVQSPKSATTEVHPSLPDFGPAPELIPGGEWFNSSPLKLKDLRGKVALVDFWTYSCINCIRTLPYLRTWHEKYANKGLVIIGVHAPEFEFEKSARNVEKAIADFALPYPVMQDNEFATWRAYQNRYWPAKYFIDRDGNIRATHFGEGAYDESEKVIQTLLAEAGSDIANMPIKNLSSPISSIDSQTPELYLGYDRVEYLASPEPIQPNLLSQYTPPSPDLPSDHFAFQGEWEIRKEFAAPSAKSLLSLRFFAKKVYLVARSQQPFHKPPRIVVHMDGLAEDMIIVNTIEVTEERLYELIDLPETDGHFMLLEFPDGNLELYAFTFG